MLLKLDNFGVQPLSIENEGLLKCNFASYQFHSLYKMFVKRRCTFSIMADHLFILSYVYVAGQNYNIRLKFFNLGLILNFLYICIVNSMICSNIWHKYHE